MVCYTLSPVNKHHPVSNSEQNDRCNHTAIMTSNSEENFYFSYLSLYCKRPRGFLVKRLDGCLERAHTISTEQHGLRRKSFTETKCKILMADVKKARAMLYTLLCVVFVDRKTGLDVAPVAPREKVMLTDIEMDFPMNVFSFIIAISQKNK